MKNPKLCKKLLTTLTSVLLVACDRYPGSIEYKNPKTPQWQSQIEKFSNCQQVQQYISSYQGQAGAGSILAQPAAAASDQNQSEHFQNQVNGVLEGDILQTNSEYFFFVRQGSIEITQKANLKKISSLKIEPNLYKKQLLYRDNQLIFLGSSFDQTYLKIFATDNNFSLVRDEKIRGEFRDFRVNENQLVIVSEFYYTQTQANPHCDQIYYPNWRDGASNVTQVTQIDLNNLKLAAQDIGVMGQTDYIYMTQTQLLLFNNYPASHFRVIDWKNNKLKLNQVERLSGIIKDQSAVQINNDLLFIAITERPEVIALGAPVAVDSATNGPGTDTPVTSIDNAASFLPPPITRKNRILVYDKNASTQYFFKSASPDFGINEDIRAVKYLDHYVYVVTFQKTDPLFVVDLQDPSHLQIKGELEVPGFSTQLIDLGNQILGGLGFDATAESQFAWITGLKFSTFDVSDPQKPLEFDHLIFGDRGSYSEATANIKALYYNSESQIVIFPAVIIKSNTQSNFDRYEESLQFAGAIVLKSTQGHLTEAGRISHKDWREKYCGKDFYAPLWSSPDNTSNDIQRNLKIDQSIYSFSPFGVTKYSADTFNVEASVEYANTALTCEK